MIDDNINEENIDEEYNNNSINDNESSDEENSGETQEENNSSKSYEWCGDIPFGFQTVNPQVFNVIGEILGDVMSNRLPYNVQNAIGNWIQLVGQIIETYSSQQNYFQSGPGRIYNLRYYNVNNPFCTENAEDTSNESEDTSSHEEMEEEINNLKVLINEMQVSIDNMNNKIKEIEEK